MRCARHWKKELTIAARPCAPWDFFKCTLTIGFCENVLSHRGHLNGRSPVCTTSCRTSWSESQGYGQNMKGRLSNYLLASLSRLCQTKYNSPIVTK